MNIEQLLKIIPKNIKINIPKTREAWEQLEKATLEVLYKIREERRIERAKKVINSKLYLIKSSENNNNIREKETVNSDHENNEYNDFKEVSLIK